MFVRDLALKLKPAMHPLEKIFIKEKIMQIFYTHENEVRQIDINKSFDVIAQDIKLNKGLNLHARG